jgi:hypothetical protein
VNTYPLFLSLFSLFFSFFFFFFLSFLSLGFYRPSSESDTRLGGLHPPPRFDPPRSPVQSYVWDMVIPIQLKPLPFFGGRGGQGRDGIKVPSVEKREINI